MATRTYHVTANIDLAKLRMTLELMGAKPPPVDAKTSCSFDLQSEVDLGAALADESGQLDREVDRFLGQVTTALVVGYPKVVLGLKSMTVKGPDNFIETLPVSDISVSHVKK